MPNSGIAKVHGLGDNASVVGKVELRWVDGGVENCLVERVVHQLLEQISELPLDYFDSKRHHMGRKLRRREGCGYE